MSLVLVFLLLLLFLSPVMPDTLKIARKWYIFLIEMFINLLNKVQIENHGYIILFMIVYFASDWTDWMVLAIHLVKFLANIHSFNSENTYFKI